MEQSIEPFPMRLQKARRMDETRGADRAACCHVKPYLSAIAWPWRT